MRALVSMLEKQLTESDSSQFEVGEQRERNHRYVTMQPLGNEVRGRSHYISPDVLDAVQSKKALFSETFFSSRQTVKFKSTGLTSAGEAAAKTAYANKVLSDNNQEELFRDGWHDAFVAKRMVVLATWMNDTTEVDIQVTGATRQMLGPIVQQSLGGKTFLGANFDNLSAEGPMLNGSVSVTVDDSRVVLELCQPERYHRDPEATYPRDAQWNSYEEDVSRGTLIDEGYDPDQVDSLTLDYRWRSNEEDFNRKAHDNSWTQRQRMGREENQETVTRYRTWTYVDLRELVEDEGYDLELSFVPREGARLYEIHWTKGEILKTAEGVHWIKEADEMPFFEWAEIKISHAEHGMCTSDVMAHTQKTQSVLKRLIIDNQQQRNNPRLEAKINAIKNPRDLLEGAIGSTIWTKETNAVSPLDVPDLSPLTLGVIGMLRDDGERRDGYSGLGKGTNTDAVRYQNADSMIERLTTAGTRRPMSAARDWAQTFLVPLCQYICKLGMRHDKSQTQAEVGGRFIVVAPQQWRDEGCQMEVAVALTPQEGKEHAQKLLLMHQVMKEDPELGPMYGANQKHALLDSVFDAMGISDSTPYLLRPDSPEYQQAKMQSQQQQQQMAETQRMAMQMQFGMAQSMDRLRWEQFEWLKTQDMDQSTRDWMTMDHKKLMDEGSLALKWTQFGHDARVDNEELELDEKELQLERQQQRAVSVGN